MTGVRLGWAMVVGYSLCVTLSRNATANAEGWRVQRSVQVDRPGAQRLAVDLDLLAGLRIALSEIRLFDDAKREVPYLLMPQPTREPTWREAAAILSTVNAKGYSGFEADLGKALQVDKLRIDGLAAPFLKRARLEGSGDRRRYTLLTREETVFDLPTDGLRHVEVDLPPGEFRYLRLTWDDQATSSVGMPTQVSVRLRDSGKSIEPVCASVPLESKPTRSKTSQWRIRLPAKHLPIVALQLDAEQLQLMRMARVSESRLVDNHLESTPLGSAMLRRALYSGISAGNLQIPVQPPETNELTLSVDNDDNPALALRRVCVQLSAQPWIYFEASQPGVYTLHYGSDAGAAHYDLEADRDAAFGREVVTSRWLGAGQPVSIPTEPTPSPPPQMLLHGSTLDPNAFAHFRRIVGHGGQMASLRLDAAVLAHSRDLSDVRILDVEHRQVPYLVERESDPLVVELELKPLAQGERPSFLRAQQSAYRVILPQTGLPASQLSLSTNSRVFRRHVALYTELRVRPGEPTQWHTLSQDAWTHADANQVSPSIILNIAADTKRSVLLVVDEGDNQPLPVTAVRLLLPGRSLRYFHSAESELTLNYGQTALESPDYDIALIARELDQLASIETSLGPEQNRLPAVSKVERAKKWFWVVLVGTVLSLVVIIVRLVKKSPTSS